jgi:hypothetical protein
MLPSIKTLDSAFPGKGKELRKYLEASHAELIKHPAGAARLAECYHPSKTYDIRLHVLDSVAETCGVEYISHRDDSYTEFLGVYYLNTGHSHNLTIVLFCETGNYRVSSWGDIVERNPKLN